MSYVFISYSHQDKESATKLEAELRANGFHPWRDQGDTGIRPGDMWKQSVEANVKASFCLLHLLSRSSVDSENVRYEVERAEHHGLLIMPLLVEVFDVPDPIASRQYVDFVRQDFDTAYRELQKRLIRYIVESRSKLTREIEGYVYWLIDDLLYAMEGLLGNNVTYCFGRGLRQATGKAEKVGVDDVVINRLKILKGEVEATPQAGWTPDKRKQVVSKLRHVFIPAATEADKKQPQFDPGQG
jgi:hypothetical protein